jgi:DNA-binding NarL/FixJ family response regulator
MVKMETQTQLPVLALVRDLMFSSKITATARAVGAEVKVVRDPGQLAGQTGRILLVDLNLPGAIEAAAQWRQINSDVNVVGFVSHVDTETIQQARDAGLTQIMARSGFVEALPELVRPRNG